MADAIRLIGLFGALAIAAAAQPLEWTAEDDERLALFERYAGECRQSLDRGLYEDAHAYLMPMKVALDHFAERGLARDGRVAGLPARYAALERQAIARTAIDPGEQLVRVVHVAEAGSGQGGARDPAPQLNPKLLGRAVEVRCAGALRLGSGPFKVAADTVALRGGYDPAFDRCDPVALPARCAPVGAGASPALQVAARQVLIDGLLFDGAALERYGAGGRLARATRKPLLRIEFSGSVLIRRCAFLNAAGGAIELVGTGGEATVEDCLFIANTGPVVRLGGKESTFRVLRSTFALVHAAGKHTEPAILATELRGLSLRENLFVRAAGLAMPAELLAATDLLSNVVHEPTGGLLHLRRGKATELVPLDALDRLDLRDAARNRALDPQLPLDAAALAAHRADATSATAYPAAAAWCWPAAEDCEAGARPRDR